MQPIPYSRIAIAVPSPASFSSPGQPIAQNVMAKMAASTLPHLVKVFFDLRRGSGHHA
jgi:hypothetical protein